MPSIINAATSGGLISTADTSGVLQLQTASTTALSISAAQVVTIAKDAVIDGLTVGQGAGNNARNTVVGNGALALNTTGQFIAAFGTNALSKNTTGNANTAFGDYSLWQSTTASSNTAVGQYCLGANTTGANNSGLGAGALESNTTGSNNTAIGYQALDLNTTASSNTAVGYQAGYTNQTGGFNVFIGHQAGYTSNFNGNAYNVCVGWASGYSLTTGVKNTFVGGGTGGLAAGGAITTGSSNTIIGAYNGNTDGLNISTSSNYAVVSDGDGNRLLSTYNGGTVALDSAVPVAGTGITFPATQSASSDANTLDDYEEGTWTPAIEGTTTAGTATYGSRNAQYIKIGRQVTVITYISWSGGTGTGGLRISGLPFTNNGGTIYGAVNLSEFDNIAMTANYYPNGYVEQSNTRITFEQSPTGGGSTIAVPYDTAGQFILTCTYFTA